MDKIERYIAYVSTQKRYSRRTVEIYDDALKRFATFFDGEPLESILNHQCIRAYQIHLLDEMGESPRTVNLHLSVLSGFCRYLVRQGEMKSNPVQLVSRPKQPKRLPVFFKDSALEKYFSTQSALSRRDFELDLSTEQERRDTYNLCLQRAVVSTLYSTGMRRAEIIALRRKDMDTARGLMRVRGKGDKMREIPLVPSCIDEISLYLQSVSALVKSADSRNGDAPLFVTYKGGCMYPALVDHCVKAELGPLGQDFSGKKSPHVLRHSLATALMEQGAEINSIKEVLGHSSLAATQVYTHSNPAQLKKVYQQAHPRGRKK